MTSQQVTNGNYTERKTQAKDAWGKQDYDAPTLMKYVTQNGKGTPLARLLDSILASFANPLGTGTVFPTIERLAESAGGISEEAVKEAVKDLHHHAHEVTDAGITFFVKPASRERASAWYGSPEHRAEWRTQKAPLKLAIRYPEKLDGDSASNLAHCLLSSSQHQGRTTSKKTSPEELARRLGISKQEIPAVLEGLRKRGWNIVTTETTILASPSDALVRAWDEFHDAALIGSNRLKAGARETAWERDVWRPSVGLTEDRKPGVETQSCPVLDVLPIGWFIYRLTDGTHSYIGITTNSLRQRLAGHLTRTGNGTREAGTNRGLITWLQGLSHEGKTPRIERIAHLEEESLSTAWAEAMEHVYVQREVARVGGDNVLNLQHHPEHEGYCSHA